MFQAEMTHLPCSETSSFNSSSSTLSDHSITPLPNGEWEVFLSFRGPDVRTSFADCLYSGLVRSKIRTFRDEEGLGKGDVIALSLLQSIAESKIYIPIFTKTYSSSKWCLMELAKMVDCWKQEKGHVILPIFYFVNPGDVRHQTGPYKESFELHSQNHDPHTVQEWKNALKDVGQLKGWHVTESLGQGAIIDEVLTKVELYLRSNYTLVTEELVGIDSHVQEVIKLLNLGNIAGGKIVGIHGMGGIGKTTIAKAVYDVLSTQYDKCCFLENVRDTLLKDDGVTTLQNYIISDILKDDKPVKSASEGVEMIRDRVCKYRVLIVLDNVDESFKFGTVLGKLDSFSLESRFIITTTNRRVLELLREYTLYEVKEMSYDHSLQLFSKHAFRMDYPLKEYEILSEKLVRLATGVPLALEVIGSLLFDRDREFWEEKVLQLKSIPCTSSIVQEKLKLSYNELSPTEKQIFLDISCCFAGEDKECPFYMWVGCNFYPESGIKTLILRSLIKIDDKNRFWMHDHLRELGKGIVIEEDVRNPCNRSRIWSNEEALNMLRKGKGTEHVEIMMVKLRDGHKLTYKKFEKLSQLRYLQVEGGKLTGDFSAVMPNLCWLRLDCYAVPTNLNMKKCVVLELLDCGVKDDWRGWNEIKIAGKLKVAKIWKCKSLTRSPDLSSCRSLEVLKFMHCNAMSGGLDIGNLKKLKKLVLNFTKIRELRGDIGLLQNLAEIVVTSSDFRKVPTQDAPTSLKRLSISCPRVPNLLELDQLEELHFMNCDVPEIPGDLWKLPRLKTLTIGYIPTQLGLPPALPPSLNRLEVRYCRYLETLPNLANLSNLTDLRLEDVGVREICGLGELRMLTSLNLRKAPKLDNLDGLESLVLLQKVAVRQCKALRKLPDLSNLTKLDTLSIVECWILTEIQGLSRLDQCLTHLEIGSTPCLTTAEGIEYLVSLQVLELASCGASANMLPPLSNLSNLKEVHITRLKHLEMVTGLDRLESLESLSVLFCESIDKLPDLSRLKNLWKLDVSGCIGLTELRGLEGLESLQRLVMSDCSSIKKLSLSWLNDLQILEATECSSMEELNLHDLENLRSVKVMGCTSIQELNLYGLKNLRTLIATGCTVLTRVNGLEELKLLQVLEVDDRLKSTLPILKFAVTRLVKQVIRLLWLVWNLLKFCIGA
ncbi:Disease resistance protein L6 [Linum perenne]